MTRLWPSLAAVPKILALACGVALFIASPLEVKAGTWVNWTNSDDITHTVTSGAPDGRDGRFNSPLAGKGATFSFTFSKPGSYPYFCERHPSMRGEIRVN